MSREILFKAKRVDNGEWVVGLPTIMWEQPHIMPMDNENKAYPYDPETLCQYTGLTDKNDNKIRENSICIIRNGSIDEEDGYFTVEWDDDAARFALNGDGLTVDFDNCYGHECEVIGNVFDDPELLKEG